MSKLIILRGLPASGKSTKAKELVEEGGKTIRLNRDLLRKMLHFDKWTPKNEGVTIEAEEELAIAMLHLGYRVIIDDTNLSEKTVSRWKGIAENVGANVEVIKIETPVDECLTRDQKRDSPVGREVIINMALKYGMYGDNGRNVIFDIDGTLCDISKRKHLVADKSNKAWKEFFARIPEDEPRKDIIEQLKKYYYSGYNVFLVSGRPDTYKKETIEWLDRYTVPYTSILMRRGGDKRPDTDVKNEIYEKYLKNLNIEAVYDDRPSVIKMWRENGLNVIDVGDGIDF